VERGIRWKTPSSPTRPPWMPGRQSIQEGRRRGDKYLTETTVARMESVVKLFRELRKKLLTKYSGDIV